MNETDAISVAMSMYDDGYNQGRADVIDELEKILNKFYHKKNNPKSEFRPSIVLMERDAESILKQLKEKQ